MDKYMVFCTLFDSGYLDKGLALYRSMRKRIGDFRLYIAAFDHKCHEVLSAMNLKNVVLIPLEEILDDRLRQKKKERTRGEFCWTCTSVVIEHVLIRYRETVCTYIDADIYFFANPAGIIRQIAEHGCSVGVAPHGFERSYWDVEQKINNGRYCIHFNTFFHTKDGMKVLREWKEDCYHWCYSRCEDGKLGDQKYADRWKMKYSCVYEIRNLGAGAAPWNVHLYTFHGRKDGKIMLGYRKEKFPLIFYHFEGLKYLDDGSVFLNLWKYTVPGLKKKVIEIYGEYFREIGAVRKYLAKNYGVTFDAMRGDKKTFMKQRCSLKEFCRNRGLLGGLQDWTGFRVNNLMREK